MGRIRACARSVLSIGGYDGISPIAKESEQNRYLRQIAHNTQRSGAGQGNPPQEIIDEWRTYLEAHKEVKPL